MRTGSPRSNITPALTSVRAGNAKFNSTTNGFRNTGISGPIPTPISLMNQSTQGSGTKKSSMLEQELKAIEKIKNKQKKEVE